MSDDKVRATLREAQNFLRMHAYHARSQGGTTLLTDTLLARIDTVLAEPVTRTPVEILVTRLGDVAGACDRLRDSLAVLERERDDARTEVEKLRKALCLISLDEYESTSSASEKVHGHARIAREALYGEKP